MLRAFILLAGLALKGFTCLHIIEVRKNTYKSLCRAYFLIFRLKKIIYHRCFSRILAEFEKQLIATSESI